MQPFRIEVPRQQMDDLAERLARTRWPPAATGGEWEQGTDAGYLYSLVKYWREGFDWQKQEALLNTFTQFKTTVDGQELHFIHQRSRHPEAVPLLLVHGWPGSIFEFYKIIPALTDPTAHGGEPEDAFHVIAPSLPGYGFSAPPSSPGATPRSFARLFGELMETHLGYARYALQGGDWGAVITSWLAYDRASAPIGLHLNMAGIRPNPTSADRPLNEAENAYLETARQMRGDVFAYQVIQGGRPQTLGYGLTDSPVGLAAWIVEKFREWSDCGGSVEKRFTKDELLTNITIYWVTNTIASSIRLYYESRRANDKLPPGGRIECPTGFADFPAEIIRPPQSWVERAYNIQRWREMPSGGHFAALEEPALLVRDIREFYRPLRAALGT